MSTEERPYLDPYLRAAEKYGAGFEALLWRSHKAQRLRFRAIATMLNTTGRAIADVGCGNADLLFDMRRRGRAPARYIGIDAVPATLEHARERARAEGVEHTVFVEHDFVKDKSLAHDLVNDAKVDAVVFCGSLNTLPERDARLILDRFWHALAPVPDAALVFNFLSDRHDRRRTPANPPAVRFDPVNMVHWALDQTPLVTFRHEYLGGHDATICMRVPSAKQPRVQ